MMQNEWTQQRLENLISNYAEESVYLDFKAAPALSNDKKKDICKDVSAFANSDGGIIIYGIEEKDHKAASFSFIDGNSMTKEWLDQVIKDGVQRRIEGVRINPVRIDNDIQKTIYVVEVPVSPFAPHMTKDNRYYKRYNFMSVPMEEYEVRNSYNRKQEVKLELGEVTVNRNISDNEMLKRKSFAYLINVNLLNSGKVPAKDYRLKTYLPNDVIMSRFDNKDVENTTDLLGYSISNIHSPTIFPNEELKVLSFELGLSFEKIHTSVPLHFTIYTETGFHEGKLDLAERIAPVQEAAYQDLLKSEKEKAETMRAVVNALM